MSENNSPAFLSPVQGAPSSIPRELQSPQSQYGRYIDFVLSAVCPPNHDSQASPDSALDKIRIVEALIARDAVVQRFERTCASLKEKQDMIGALQREKAELETRLKLGGLSLQDRDSKEKENQLETKDVVRTTDLRMEVEKLRGSNKNLVGEVEKLNSKLRALEKERSRAEYFSPFDDGLEFLKSPEFGTPLTTSSIPSTPDGTDVSRRLHSTDKSNSAAETRKRIEARHKILAQLSLPSNMPSDILVPFMFPPLYTIHDFLGTVTGLLKRQLGNYQIFQECTTSWCPEREEHGFYITPAYKCITNPRASTAHTWTQVDLSNEKLQNMFNCFYNKEGKWYYAGVYKTLRMEDLSAHEWENLSKEATQLILRSTLEQRKNTSPQNLYETSQLYTVGALKAACIGLQCVGFNLELYQGLLEQVKTCTKNGSLSKNGPSVGNPVGMGGAGIASGIGLGMAGGVWNVTANPTAAGFYLRGTAGSNGLNTSDAAGARAKDDTGFRVTTGRT